MKKILAIGIIALLALGVGLGVVSGLTRNEVEPPQPLGIGIDGGDLSVIECIQGQDAVCTARGETGHQGSVGQTYDIIVDYHYDDRICVWGNDITFRLTGPDGTTDERVIHDGALFDDGETGKLQVSFTPTSPGPYYWTIYCEERGVCSSTSQGSITIN